MNYEESIGQVETEARLEDLDISFTVESIKYQLENILDTSSKQNYLKKFNKEFNKIDLGMNPELLNEREAMYDDIIDLIADKYELTVYKEDINFIEVTKTLYKFFVVDFIDNIIHFLEMYIVENKASITSILKRSEHISVKKIEGVDDSISLILNNVTEVMKIIKNSNITFNVFLETAETHPDVSVSVKKIGEIYETLISEDEKELFDTIMEPIFSESDGFAYIYTQIQLALCNRYSND
jgi:hypothetical protein